MDSLGLDDTLGTGDTLLFDNILGTGGILGLDDNLETGSTIFFENI